MAIAFVSLPQYMVSRAVLISLEATGEIIDIPAHCFICSLLLCNK